MLPHQGEEKKFDIQKVLGNLDKLDVIENSMTALEIVVMQITEKSGKIEEKGEKTSAKCEQVRETTEGVKAQGRI